MTLERRPLDARTTASLPARPRRRSARARPALAGAVLAAALLAAAAPAAAHGPAGETARAERQQERADAAKLFKAFFPDVTTARRAAVSLHGSLLETDYAGGWQVFELDVEQQALLQRFGYRLEPATDFARRRAALLDAIDRNAAAAAAASGPAAAGDARRSGLQSIPNYACYETVEESFAAAQAMAAARPDLASWSDLGDSWQKSVGQGGYDMRVLRLTNTARPGPKPKLVITSAIHAREYVTAPLALAFARWLFDGYGTHPDATWLMDHHEVQLLLQTNPDGRKKAEGGLSWRKNTNTAYCGPRSNSRGADLNRNFGFSWNSTGGQGSSGNACDATYRGPSAASEPETRAVEAWIRGQFADARGPGKTDAAPADTPGMHIDLHSYSELVLWPWGDTATPAPNGAALQTLGRRLAFFNGYTPQQSIGLYPTDGTSDGPSYGELGIAAFTFELGTSFFQDCASYQNTILPKNLQALVYAAKASRAPYLLPSGPDVSSLSTSASVVEAGTPVGVSAVITDTRFSARNGAEAVQAIAAAEVFVDVPPWAPGARPQALLPSDGGFDSATETVSGTLATAGWSPGRHLLFVRGIDASGAAGPVSAVFLDIGGTPPPPPPVVTLTLTGTRIKAASWRVDLAFGGAPGANVDVWRNGALLATTANDGAFSDTRGRGTWVYRVCAAGTATCSPERSITF